MLKRCKLFAGNTRVNAYSIPAVLYELHFRTFGSPCTRNRGERKRKAQKIHLATYQMEWAFVCKVYKIREASIVNGYPRLYMPERLDRRLSMEGIIMTISYSFLAWNAPSPLLDMQTKYFGHNHYGHFYSPKSYFQYIRPETIRSSLMHSSSFHSINTKHAFKHALPFIHWSTLSGVLLHQCGWGVKYFQWSMMIIFFLNPLSARYRRHNFQILVVVSFFVVALQM